MEAKLLTRVYVVRHAEAEGNLYRRAHGHYDSLITDNGNLQIEALRERFREERVDAVLSSDLRRTSKTASALCGGRELRPILHPGLREIHMGDWEDLPWGQILRDSPTGYELFEKEPWRASIPGGETVARLSDRVWFAFMDILKRYDGRAVAIVSHAMAIQSLMCRLDKRPLESFKDEPLYDNASVTAFDYDGSVAKFICRGDNTHLGELSTYNRHKRQRLSGGLSNNYMWFRPVDIETELNIYLRLLRIAGTGGFDERSEYVRFERMTAITPLAVQFAMLGEDVAGILQLDIENTGKPRCGIIDNMCLLPAYQEKGLGVQLLGQAVSFYRRLGKDKIAMYLSNTRDVRSYFKKYGFFEQDSDGDGYISLVKII